MKKLSEVACFSGLDFECVQHVVDQDGIAKVPQLLGASSLQWVCDRFGEQNSYHSHQELGNLPEFDELMQALEPSRGSRRKVRRHTQPATVSTFKKELAHKEQSHADTAAVTGISVIVPYLGPRALFAASRDPFMFSERTFSDVEALANPEGLPDWLTEYGPGDGIVVRQKLTSFNGRPVSPDCASQMEHLGLAAGSRWLLAVDVRPQDLYWPAKTT